MIALWGHSLGLLVRLAVYCKSKALTIDMSSRRFIDVLTEIRHITVTLLALCGDRGAPDPARNIIYGVRGGP